MPLSEFLKMLKNESGEKKAVSSSPSDLSTLPENDFVELVWENGQTVVQGLPSRGKKSATLNNHSLQTSRMQEKYVGNASTSRVGKLDLATSVLEEMPSWVPSGEMDLSQDDEIVPWLNYSQEFGSQILPEVSGMTGNEPSAHNGFPLMDKGGSCNLMFGANKNVSNHNVVKSGQRNGSKLDSSSRFGMFSSWSSQQANPIRSGVSDIISSNGSINTKLPKQDTETLFNFPNFSRPVALARANLQNASSSSPAVEAKEKMGKVTLARISTSKDENDLSTQPNLLQTKFEPRPMPAKPHGDSFSIEHTDASFRDDPSDDNGKAPGKLTSDKAVELGACSSVCSGSSAERASNDQPRCLKRRNQENEESGCQSEDAEEESAGVKKSGPTRGMGPKRTRAAEVHNLSERRRRDRINEKMRALQELIPNCNKADKASMLDEAIEYLKTLQLQVQIMSMGAGLCMPQMMFPSGMHPQMPHFPHMGLGMGMGPVFPVPPMPRPHFHSPSISAPTSFPGMAASNIQAFGHPGHGISMPIPRTPYVPLPPQPINNKNLQLDRSQITNQTTNQVQTSDNLELPASVRKGDQQLNGSDDRTS